MTILEPEFGDEAQAEEEGCRSSKAANRRVLELEHKKDWIDENLEESLSAALQAADGEFGQLLREVDGILKVLKSPTPDKTTLRIAEHPAVWGAVKQALVDRELRRLALTDDLTCLFNRRGFFAAATQQLRRATRQDESMLLFFCDVDGLKRINDNYGHAEGDLALIRVADALEKTFRGSDVVARLGGDEFIVLALEAGPESEVVIRQRLAKNLKKTKSAGVEFGLSMSVGMARFDSNHRVTLGELMLQADEAMYEQKQKRQLSIERGAHRMGSLLPQL